MQWVWPTFRIAICLKTVLWGGFLLLWEVVFGIRGVLRAMLLETLLLLEKKMRFFLIMLGFLIMGCGVVHAQDAVSEDPNAKILYSKAEDASFNIVSVWTDPETKCEYLQFFSMASLAQDFTIDVETQYAVVPRSGKNGRQRGCQYSDNAN